MRALLNAVAPLLGAEAELNGPVGKDWASPANKEKIEEWRKVGLEAAEDLQHEFESVYESQYLKLMRKVSSLHSIYYRSE